MESWSIVFCLSGVPQESVNFGCMCCLKWLVQDIYHMHIKLVNISFLSFTIVKALRTPLKCIYVHNSQRLCVSTSVFQSWIINLTIQHILKTNNGLCSVLNQDHLKFSLSSCPEQEPLCMITSWVHYTYNINILWVQMNINENM